MDEPLGQKDVAYESGEGYVIYFFGIKYSIYGTSGITGST